MSFPLNKKWLDDLLKTRWLKNEVHPKYIRALREMLDARIDDFRRLTIERTRIIEDVEKPGEFSLAEPEYIEVIIPIEFSIREFDEKNNPIAEVILEFENDEDRLLFDAHKDEGTGMGQLEQRLRNSSVANKVILDDGGKYLYNVVGSNLIEKIQMEVKEAMANL